MKQIGPFKGKKHVKVNQVQHSNCKCYFCGKLRRMKVECPKRTAWFENKSEPFTFVYFESNIVNDSSNSWCLDSSTNVHVSIIMQGYIASRIPKPSK